MGSAEGSAAIGPDGLRVRRIVAAASGYASVLRVEFAASAPSEFTGGRSPPAPTCRWRPQTPWLVSPPSLRGRLL